MRDILRLMKFAVLAFLAIMAAGAIADLGLPRMPWQEDPGRAAAREELEACLWQNAHPVLGLAGCSRARIDRLRYEVFDK